MENVKIKVEINGENKTWEVPVNEKLLDTLRRYGYKSVKKGCGEGTCGTCTVLINNTPVNSCIIFSVSVDGCKIMTVEGLGTIDNPHLLQSSIVETGGVQCGYCTPGFLMSAYALLLKNPAPSIDDVRRATDGNLCRCTGYVKRVEGVMLAAKKMRGEK